MRHLNKFNTISEYTTAEPTLSMPNLSLIMEDNTVRTVKDDEIVFIEYLQSTGTQYISTNIIPDANTGIMLTIMRLNNTDSYICGVRNDSGSTRWVLGCPNYSGYGSVITTSSYPAINIKYDVGLNYLNDKKFTIPLNDVSTNLPTLSFTPTTDIRLFGSSGVNASYTKWTGKIYACKISQNNSIVCNLIPVRIGTVGYMYDTVSKKLFANAGTGNFTLGPDITAVEYLQSDGNQYIDTGIIPNISTGIKISYMKQSTSTDRSEAIFGLQNVQNTYTCWYAIAVKGSTSDPNYIRFGRQTYWSVGAHKAPYDVINTISLNYFNNRKSTTSNPSMTFDFSGAGSYNFNYDPMFTALYDIRLFGLNGYKSYQNLIGRIYSCTISQGNKIIMDMIPVRIDTEGCMFDKVSRRFFRNNGTGNFTYGADVAGVDLVNRKEYIKF